MHVRMPVGPKTSNLQRCKFFLRANNWCCKFFLRANNWCCCIISHACTAPATKARRCPARKRIAPSPSLLFHPLPLPLPLPLITLSLSLPSLAPSLALPGPACPSVLPPFPPPFSVAGPSGEWGFSARCLDIVLVTYAHAGAVVGIVVALAMQSVLH
jgi:hypothetical protein